MSFNKFKRYDMRCPKDLTELGFKGVHPLFMKTANSPAQA